MNELGYAVTGFVAGGFAVVSGLYLYFEHQITKLENEETLKRFTESYNAGILNTKPTMKNVREIRDSFQSDFPENERFLVKKNGLETSVTSDLDLD